MSAHVLAQQRTISAGGASHFRFYAVEVLVAAVLLIFGSQAAYLSVAIGIGASLLQVPVAHLGYCLNSGPAGRSIAWRRGFATLTVALAGLVVVSILCDAYSAVTALTALCLSSFHAQIELARRT